MRYDTGIASGFVLRQRRSPIEKVRRPVQSQHGTARTMMWMLKSLAV
ncbi:hypothetical protein [Roseovarius tolerans]|nr:hypothetical protein [Roseovarius tolerans]